MDPDGLLRELVAARDGHFRLESGHHGPLWLDLDPLFLRPDRVAPLAAALGARIASHGVDVVCGPLVGGAFLAQMIGPVAVYAERTGPTSDALYSAEYRIPAGLRPVLAGRRVAVVDDVVNAGSATRATVAAVRSAGGTPVLVAALLRLGDAVATFAEGAGLALETLATWPSPLWEPATCPRCAAGEPLTDAS